MPTPSVLPLPDDVGPGVAAVATGVAWVDRSHWTQLELTGADRLNFLHSQTTNDFKRLQTGQGCETVFVTATARTIDLATAYINDDSVLILASPGLADRLLAWLDRYIFPADQVAVRDRSAEFACFTVLGPESAAWLDRVGLLNLAIGQVLPLHHHQTVVWQGNSVQIAAGSGLAVPGFTLWLAAGEPAAALVAAFNEAGLPALSETDWEILRIQQGRPKPGQELTDEFNAVEAALWRGISLNKGCYIGQETIARLDTYKGVRQQLWGIYLPGCSEAIAPGTPLFLPDSDPVTETTDPKPASEPDTSEPDTSELDTNESAVPTIRPIGQITSSWRSETGVIALGYVRTKAGGAGLAVVAHTDQAQWPGIVLELPFATRDRLV